MTDRIRVLRVLEYEGPREWVETAMAQRSVKGEKRIKYSLPQRVNAVIRESIIGETPVVLQVKKPSTLYYVSGIPGEAPVLIKEPEPLSTASGRKAERQMASQFREQEGKRKYHVSDCDILRWPHDKCNCGAGYDVIGF